MKKHLLLLISLFIVSMAYTQNTQTIKPAKRVSKPVTPAGVQPAVTSEKLEIEILPETMVP